MRFVLLPVFLAALAVQDNDAEKLFRAMEKKIRGWPNWNTRRTADREKIAPSDNTPAAAVRVKTADLFIRRSPVQCMSKYLRRRFVTSWLLNPP